MKLSAVATLGLALTGLQIPVQAETWYLYTTIHSGGSYSATTRPAVLEMDTKQGCEVVGNILKAEAESNKLEHIKNLSFTCVKRQ